MPGLIVYVVRFAVMPVLTTEIKDFVKTQKLGYVATVCPDGTPNLSPKGTTTVWDDDHLVFLDIYSPGTVANLLANPSIEINIVDIFTRKGYRFKGTAEIFSGGELFDQVITTYGEAVKKYSVKNVVLVKIEKILPVLSPAYDAGLTENQLIKTWKDYWNSIH